jgi:hypothetical protein
MTKPKSLGDPDKVFEATYSFDEGREFKITMRRDKLFGLWAASIAGLTDDEAQAYARKVIESEIDTHTVAHTVFLDLTARGISITEDQLKAKLLEMEDEARTQLSAPGLL